MLLKAKQIIWKLKAILKVIIPWIKYNMEQYKNFVNELKKSNDKIEHRESSDSKKSKK